MSAKNLFAALLSSLILIGCGPKEIDVLNVPTERAKLNLAEPAPVKPKKVLWYVITPENAQAVFDDLKSKKYNLVLFGLTDDGYENLSTNVAEFRKFIIEQRAIIESYKFYYESEDISEQE